MRVSLYFFMFCFFVGLTINGNCHDFEIKSGFANQLIAEGLINPTCVAIAPDGRVFITEKGGDVRIVEEGNLLPTPFLHVDVDESGERGLGAIVLDPHFEQNNFVYIYYTVAHQNENRLSRFTANGNLAVPFSEEVIMEFGQLAGVFHNGGAMRFENDTTLFVSTGEAIQTENAQDSTNLLGKMLRIYRDGTIPEDNPFFNELEGDNRAIYAFGLRNPFTFDIHPTTKQVLVNDVGLTSWEEINDIQPGKNYGWPIVEGNLDMQTPPANYQDPLYTYPHGPDIGCAVVGGAFYVPTTPNFPEQWQDNYLFSDFCTGTIQLLDPTAGTILDTLMIGEHFISNMAISQDGYLYYIKYYTGELWKVQYVGDGAPFISKQPQTELVPVGENIDIAIGVVGDSTLTYRWFLDDVEVLDQFSDTFLLENAQLSDSGLTLYCRAHNYLDTVWSDTITLLVTTNQRPLPVIVLPQDTMKYNNGDTLRFEGFASDPEDGPLDAVHLEWTINFHHDEHFHPAMPSTPHIFSGEMPIPRLGETDTTVWYRVHLKATDALGMPGSAFVDVHPNKTAVTLLTSPTGLGINLDGAAFETPYSFVSVVGNTRTVVAPTFQPRNDSLFRFVAWSHGDTSSTLSFNPGQSFDTLTALYTYVRPYFDGNGTGLLGTYFDNIDFQEPAVFDRIDPEINFLWDYSSFIMTGQGDSIAALWTGSLLAPITGDYTFFLEYDDRVSLTLDGNLIIEDNTSANGASKDTTVALEAGVKYNIFLQFTELQWIARIKLFWEFVDQPKQIVPQRFLYPEGVSTSGNFGFLDATPRLYLFPNPAEELVHLAFDTINGQYSLEVFNRSGQLVKKKQIADKMAGSTYTLDVSDFHPGLYIIRLTSAEVRRIGKFVIK